MQSKLHSIITGVPTLLKIDLISNLFEIFKDALYIREVSIEMKRKLYRSAYIIFIFNCIEINLSYRIINL